MIELTLSSVNWHVCLTSSKQINKCREGICLYEILCDKIWSPKRKGKDFYFGLQDKCNKMLRLLPNKKYLNKQHINIHSLLQRFDVEILNTAIFSDF